MRHATLLSLLALMTLPACGKDKDPAGDDDTGGAGEEDGGGITLTDVDADGYPAEFDCNDNDPDIRPAAPEDCDGIDNNCDGNIDEGFSDLDLDGTPDCLDAEECDGIDNDGDGLIDEEQPDTDLDGIPDCQDVEACDGLDNDGDGDFDEDFDEDGDGYSPCTEFIGEWDCDDDDADVSPDASEVAGDAIDNDCDGLMDPELWEGDVSVWITEILNNPGYVADHRGEWFELHNSGTEGVYINGLTLRSGAGENHQILSSEPIFLDAGGHVVLGINGNVEENGGVPVAYAYSDISLGNEGDTLEVWLGAELLDQVTWDESGAWPDPNGASISLDPSLYSATYAENPLAWCEGAASTGLSLDLASPGALNLPCAPADRDGDGARTDEGDCDDLDPTRSPTLPEVCDGFDNDCDSLVDAADPSVADAVAAFMDADLDEYGDANLTSSLVCEVGGSLPAGWAENDEDCDDGDALISPDGTEVAYDTEDQDCDGGDRVDADFDGFAAVSAGGTDCDDTDADIRPYAWEDTTDGIDNDCDGGVDGSDLDIPTLLSLANDALQPVAIAPLDFCNNTYTTLVVSSNGVAVFNSYIGFGPWASRSRGDFTYDVGAAMLWTDLDPSSCGEVSVITHADAVAVHYRGVCLAGSSDTITGSIVFQDGGRVWTSIDAATGLTTGLTGVSCGNGAVGPETDFSAVEWADGSMGVGNGLIGNWSEDFSGGADLVDLSGVLPFCPIGGADGDSDGWTTACGDANDADANIHPM
jgi:hypothetical protein